jgi:hypothetical protein
MRLVAIVPRVGASVDTAGLFSPRPLAKGADDGQDQSLEALAAAAGMLVAVGMLVLIMVVVEARPAEATFPGKNGRIAYNTSANACCVIYTINPGGGGKTKVTMGGTPSYSPNGKRIAYSDLDGHDTEIYTINVGGGGKTRVTNTDKSDEFSPSYSPNGMKIAYTVYKGNSFQGDIYTINAFGGGKTQLTNDNADEGSPSWGSRP